MDLPQAVESPNLVSVSRPSFVSLGLKGYKSRIQAYCVETLNTATICLSKTSNSTCFLSVVAAGK